MYFKLRFIKKYAQRIFYIIKFKKHACVNVTPWYNSDILRSMGPSYVRVLRDAERIQTTAMYSAQRLATCLDATWSSSG
jgi:hypothetical protein